MASNEQLVLDMMGDSSDWDETLDDAEKETTKFGDVVKNVFVAIAAYLAVDKIREWAGGWIEAAAGAELAETKLTGVVQATGEAAGISADNMVMLSEQLQKVTRFEAETTQGAMGVLAAFKNIKGDNFQQTVIQAQNLAEALEMDLVGATNMLAKALVEPGEGLNALRKAGVALTEQEEEMINKMVESGDAAGAQAATLKLIEDRYGGLAEKMGGTFAGKQTIMTNRLGDLAEMAGGWLIPVMDEVNNVMGMGITVLENISPWIETLVKDFITLGKSIIEWMQPAFEFIIDAGVLVVSALQTYSTHWAEIFELLGLNISIVAVEAYETIKYYFTEVIPAFLGWFAENWFDLWMDMQRLQATVIINMGKNIWDFILYVKGLLTGSGEEFKFTGLLEGFEMTVKELPKIADQAESAMLKGMKERSGKLGKEVGDDFTKNFMDNKKAVDDALKPQAAGKIGVENDRPMTPTEQAKKPPEEPKEKKDAADKASSSAPKEKEISASFEALDSLGKRIQEASASTRETEKVTGAINTSANFNVQAMAQGVERHVKAQTDTKDEVVKVLKEANQDNRERHRDVAKLLMEIRDKKIDLTPRFV